MYPESISQQLQSVGPSEPDELLELWLGLELELRLDELGLELELGLDELRLDELGLELELGLDELGLDELDDELDELELAQQH